jgi:hypothetical protein
MFCSWFILILSVFDRSNLVPTSSPYLLATVRFPGLFADSGLFALLFGQFNNISTGSSLSTIFWLICFGLSCFWPLPTFLWGVSHYFCLVVEGDCLLHSWLLYCCCIDRQV